MRTPRHRVAAFQKPGRGPSERGEGTAVPLVKCSVDGCNARLQPLAKPILTARIPGSTASATAACGRPAQTTRLRSAGISFATAVAGRTRPDVSRYR